MKKYEIQLPMQQLMNKEQQVCFLVGVCCGIILVLLWRWITSNSEYFNVLDRTQMEIRNFKKYIDNKYDFKYYFKQRL